MSLKDILYHEAFLFEYDIEDYKRRKKNRELMDIKKYKEEGHSDKYKIERNEDGKAQTYRSRAQVEPEHKFKFIDKRINSADKSHALENPRFGHKEPVPAYGRAPKDIENAYTYQKNRELDEKSQKDFKASRKKIANARQYAERITKDIDAKYGRDSYEAQAAKDAARRHYRNTHKNESTELYEGAIELI